MATIAGGIALLLVVVGVAAYALWPSDNNGGGPGGSPAASPACGYKIAFMGVLTGSGNGDGVPIRDSAKLAVEQYNAKHAGCTVQLVEYDTQNASNGKDELATSRTDEIVADSTILGLVGPIYRDEVRAALPALERANLPMITPSASDSDLSQSASMVFHRVLGTDLDQASAAARQLTNVVKATKTYVVHDGTPVGSTMADQVDFQLGSGRSVGKDSVAAQTDYPAVLKKIKDSGADSVYYAGLPQAGGAFIKQLRAAQPNISIVAGGRVFTDLTVNTAGKSSVEGAYVVHASIPADQAGDGFANQFMTRYSRSAGYYGAESFDATNIFLAGLAKGKSTRSDMLAWVHAYDGQGTSRHIKFTARGDLAGPKLQIWAYKIADGSFKPDSVIAEN